MTPLKDPAAPSGGPEPSGADPLDALLESLPTVAVQGFGEDYRINFWNGTSTQLYGWTREQALGRDLPELMLMPADRPGYREVVEPYRRGLIESPPPVAIEVMHRDGHTLPMLCCLARREYADGRVQVFCLDIDLRAERAATEALRQAQQRLSLALAGANDGIWDWDIVNGTAHFSERFRQLLGYDNEAAFDGEFRFRDALHPEDHATTTAMMDAHLNAGGPMFDCDYRLRCRDDSWRWFHGRGRALHDAAGRPLRFAGAITDITSRRDTEQALRASQERLQAFAELSADWFWETDTEHRYTALHGQDGSAGEGFERAIGRQRWEVDDGGLSPEAWASHRTLLARHESFRNLELRRIGPDGRERFQIVSGRPRFDGAGRFAGYIGVGRDLTELHEARRERERLQMQLRESQKLEALGTLASGVAHDFNNLLGAMLATMKMAREDAATGTPVLDHLEQLERTGRRARDLVQRILAYTRRVPASTAAVCVQPLLSETIAMLRATLPARVTLETEMADEPLWAELDAGQWQPALMNLGVNAWQSLGEGPGQIRFGAAPARLADGRDAVELWVQDSGCGMDDETRRRAFDPFFTTKAPGEGTGLGLALVHSVVTMHGGQIRLDSAPRAGTKVHILLPRVLPAAPSAEVMGKPTPMSALPNGTQVLLVDDDEVVRIVATALLERAGCVVHASEQAQQAIQALAAEPGRWDVLVTDLHMPGLDGLVLAHRALELVPGLPVVLVSGNLEDTTRARALTLGVSALVNKERIAEELQPVISRLLSPAETGPD